jgi:hypothetical protein
LQTFDSQSNHIATFLGKHPRANSAIPSTKWYVNDHFLSCFYGPNCSFVRTWTDISQNLSASYSNWDLDEFNARDLGSVSDAVPVPLVNQLPAGTASLLGNVLQEFGLSSEDSQSRNHEDENADFQRSSHKAVVHHPLSESVIQAGTLQSRDPSVNVEALLAAIPDTRFMLTTELCM